MAATCYLCGRPVYSDGNGDCAPQEDHINPGQPQTRWTHAWCNQVKGDRSVGEAKTAIAEHFRRGTAPRCLG